MAAIRMHPHDSRARRPGWSTIHSMTSPDAAAALPAPAGKGEFARLTGVLFEPTKTFADIARRPGWMVPLALLILASIGVTALYGQHVGWERLIRHQIETTSRGQQIPPEQREQAIATQARMAPLFGYVGTLVAIPLYCLLAAGIFTGLVAGVMAAQVRFKQVFGVVVYASMPNVIAALLTAVVMLLKNPDDFDLQNPLIFNAGALMDPDHGSKFLHSIAASIDLFSFWAMLLMATGLMAAAGRKLSFGGALFVVALPWAAYVLAKSALAGLFG